MQHRSLFSYTSENPYHLSVGAAMLNDAGLVACHHFADFEGVKDLYILMRESVEENESLEAAVARGLQEEFGATATLDKYLGSLVSHFPLPDGRKAQKTTLYFLTRQVGPLVSRRPGDEEASSDILFLSPAELIMKMRAQAARIPNRTDLDESEIIERAVNAHSIKTHPTMPGPPVGGS